MSRQNRQKKTNLWEVLGPPAGLPVTAPGVADLLQGGWSAAAGQLWDNLRVAADLVHQGSGTDPTAWLALLHSVGNFKRTSGTIHVPFHLNGPATGSFQ